MKRERKAYSRDERKEQILTAFTVNLQATGNDEMTVADIARYLKITPSGKLRDIITELVIDSYLTVQVEKITTGGAVAIKRWYSLPADSIYRRGHHEAAKHRNVQIKSRGRLLGQMELKF